MDFAPSKLELGLSAVFVEGKNDFYMLAYFGHVLFDGKHDVRFVPSSGANDLGPLISLYLGWGKKFVVLLDDDAAGRSARDRYRKDWSLASSIVLTIGDLLPTLKGGALEKILSLSGRKLIAAELGKRAVTKKDIGRFFQERFAQNKKFEFDDQTLGTMTTLLVACEKMLSEKVE